MQSLHTTLLQNLHVLDFVKSLEHLEQNFLLQLSQVFIPFLQKLKLQLLHSSVQLLHIIWPCSLHVFMQSLHALFIHK